MTDQSPEKTDFGNAFSRHANFTKFCTIVTIDVRNKPRKFQIDISKIGYFTEQSVKLRQVLVCKLQTKITKIPIFGNATS